MSLRYCDLYIKKSRSNLSLISAHYNTKPVRKAQRTVHSKTSSQVLVSTSYRYIGTAYLYSTCSESSGLMKNSETVRSTLFHMTKSGSTETGYRIYMHCHYKKLLVRNLSEKPVVQQK